MTIRYQRESLAGPPEETIHYTDTGPSIVYGPSTPSQQDGSTFSPDSTINPSYSLPSSAASRTREILPCATARRRNYYHSGNRLLAAAAAMITADATNDESPTLMNDESPTHLESQIFQLSATQEDSQVPPAPPLPPLPSTVDESEPQEPSNDTSTRPPEFPPQTVLEISPTVNKRSRGRPKSAITTTSISRDSLPEFWSDCKTIYPDSSEIAAALQDPGKKVMKIVNGTRQPNTSFPLIQKLCTKIYQAIQSIYNPDGLTKNVTRGREALASLILCLRKTQDVTNLDPFYHKYAVKGQVFIITNDPVHSGINIAIKQYQESIVDVLRKAKTNRTPNDGLRLALTMLDSKYRAGISTIMTHRKDRKQSDIAGDYVLHFFEKMLVESFQDPAYKPPQVARSLFGDISEDELENWDPNDPKIFQVPRTAEWLLDTWKQYVRRKYKEALDRWNKDTGGGNGQAWSFVNYCDKEGRWLVAVFLKDKETNFLLAANAGGRMPNYLQMECGFEPVQDISSLDGSVSGEERCSSEERPSAKSSSTNRKRVIQEEQAATKQLKSEMTSTMTKLSSWYDDKKKHMKDPQTEVLDEVIKMNQAIKDTESLNSMSPNTREMYTMALHVERKRLIEKMSKLVREKQD